jgi:hypothetical protein
MMRVEAMERIKALLPEWEPDPLAKRGGPEFEHASDLKSLADTLEQRLGGKTSTRKDE